MKPTDLKLAVQGLLIAGIGLDGISKFPQAARLSDSFWSVAYNSGTVLAVGMVGIGAYGITKAIGNTLDRHEPKL